MNFGKKSSKEKNSEIVKIKRLEKELMEKPIIHN